MFGKRKHRYPVQPEGMYIHGVTPGNVFSYTSPRPPRLSAKIGWLFVVSGLLCFFLGFCIGKLGAIDHGARSRAMEVLWTG